MNNKMRVTPCACVSHDEQKGRLQIELELPGADKKDITLEMRKDSFCVTARGVKIQNIRVVLYWP